MTVYKDINNIEFDRNTVVSVGTFDGIHLGHQEIIRRITEDSQDKGCRNIVITFEPHPRIVVARNFDIRLLTDYDEKLRLLDSFGIQNVLVIRFDNEFAGITYEEFFENFLMKIGVSEIVIGHDHRFGRGRDGDEEKLLALGRHSGVEIVKVMGYTVDGQTVSSTKIRHALQEGEVEKAGEYLGRLYSLTGKVVEGLKRGRTIGFPTANIELNDEHKLVPKNGVYSVEAELDGRVYKAMMNIGFRPTFEDSVKKTIEVFIHDFDRQIYGQELTVRIKRKLRDEVKYASVEELIAQLKKDASLSEEQ